MSDIINVLRNMEEFDFIGGVSEEEIIVAETNLGLQFALDYKDYLLEFGLASVDGHEFTGIIKSPRLNVVDVTIKVKKKFDNVPTDAYVLEEWDIDGIVIFQRSDGSIFKANPKSKFLKIADSFVEYLEK